jgi:hydrogenase maturation protein HypF
MSILRDDMPKTEEQARLRLRLRGAVQGVGFQPFVYRLATELRLSGWVVNSSQGVLIEGIVAVAEQVGKERIVLTGGCFQSRYLSERAVGRLRTEGFRPYWHQRIPPNDGGIALGQIVAASRALEAGRCV